MYLILYAQHSIKAIPCNSWSREQSGNDSMEISARQSIPI